VESQTEANWVIGHLRLRVSQKLCSNLSALFSSLTRYSISWLISPHRMLIVVDWTELRLVHHCYLSWISSSQQTSWQFASCWQVAVLSWDWQSRVSWWSPAWDSHRMLVSSQPVWFSPLQLWWCGFLVSVFSAPWHWVSFRQPCWDQPWASPSSSRPRLSLGTFFSLGLQVCAPPWSEQCRACLGSASFWSPQLSWVSQKSTLVWWLVLGRLSCWPPPRASSWSLGLKLVQLWLGPWPRHGKQLSWLSVSFGSSLYIGGWDRLTVKVNWKKLNWL